MATPVDLFMQKLAAAKPGDNVSASLDVANELEMDGTLDWLCKQEIILPHVQYTDVRLVVKRGPHASSRYVKAGNMGSFE